MIFRKKAAAGNVTVDVNIDIKGLDTTTAPTTPKRLTRRLQTFRPSPPTLLDTALDTFALLTM